MSGIIGISTSGITTLLALANGAAWGSALAWGGAVGLLVYGIAELTRSSWPSNYLPSVQYHRPWYDLFDLSRLSSRYTYVPAPTARRHNVVVQQTAPTHFEPRTTSWLPSFSRNSRPASTVRQTGLARFEPAASTVRQTGPARFEPAASTVRQTGPARFEPRR